MQGGHTGQTSAHAGDVINAAPVSYGGGVMIGDIGTGNKMQNPTSEFGGSTGTGGFDFKMPSMPKQGGGGGGDPPAAGALLVNLYQQPQMN